MSDRDDDLRAEASRMLTEAAKSAITGTDEATRAKRKRWLAIGAVVGGGFGLLLLWSLISKIGAYLMMLLFGAAVCGGAYYLLRGKYDTWSQARLAARSEADAAKAEVDKRKAAEAELEALKRRAR